MPDLVEQIYNSQQIIIPPDLPSILKTYAKAAIRTQPGDLLTWSSAYFRALSLGLPPPSKDRLEYPPVETPFGLSPGYLRVLINQIGKEKTVSRDILSERWEGLCLNLKALQDLLDVGMFENEVRWMEFLAICAGTLELSLTRTMIQLCELLTDEPEGGRAAIPVTIFLNLYKYLANLDCGPVNSLEQFDKDQKEDLETHCVIEQSTEEEVTTVIEDDLTKVDSVQEESVMVEAAELKEDGDDSSGEGDATKSIVETEAEIVESNDPKEEVEILQQKTETLNEDDGAHDDIGGNTDSGAGKEVKDCSEEVNEAGENHIGSIQESAEKVTMEDSQVDEKENLEEPSAATDNADQSDVEKGGEVKTEENQENGVEGNNEVISNDPAVEIENVNEDEHDGEVLADEKNGDDAGLIEGVEGNGSGKNAEDSPGQALEETDEVRTNSSAQIEIVEAPVELVTLEENHRDIEKDAKIDEALIVDAPENTNEETSAEEVAGSGSEEAVGETTEGSRGDQVEDGKELKDTEAKEESIADVNEGEITNAVPSDKDNHETSDVSANENSDIPKQDQIDESIPTSGNQEETKESAEEHALVNLKESNDDIVAEDDSKNAVDEGSASPSVEGGFKEETANQSDEAVQEETTIGAAEDELNGGSEITGTVDESNEETTDEAIVPVSTAQNESINESADENQDAIGDNPTNATHESKEQTAEVSEDAEPNNETIKISDEATSQSQATLDEAKEESEEAVKVVPDSAEVESKEPPGDVSGDVEKPDNETSKTTDETAAQIQAAIDESKEETADVIQDAVKEITGAVDESKEQTAEGSGSVDEPSSEIIEVTDEAAISAPIDEKNAEISQSVVENVISDVVGESKEHIAQVSGVAEEQNNEITKIIDEEAPQIDAAVEISNMETADVSQSVGEDVITNAVDEFKEHTAQVSGDVEETINETTKVIDEAVPQIAVEMPKDETADVGQGAVEDVITNAVDESKEHPAQVSGDVEETINETTKVTDVAVAQIPATVDESREETADVSQGAVEDEIIDAGEESKDLTAHVSGDVDEPSDETTTVTDEAVTQIPAIADESKEETADGSQDAVEDLITDGKDESKEQTSEISTAIDATIETTEVPVTGGAEESAHSSSANENGDTQNIETKEVVAIGEPTSATEEKSNNLTDDDGTLSAPEGETINDAMKEENVKVEEDPVVADELIEVATNPPLEDEPTAEEEIMKSDIREEPQDLEVETDTISKKATPECQIKDIARRKNQKWIHIPGIGPIVPDHVVEEAEKYFLRISKVQEGMVMPRNIRHFRCPPLEPLTDTA